VQGTTEEEPATIVKDGDGEAAADVAEDQVIHMLHEVNRERIENNIAKVNPAGTPTSLQEQEEKEATTADDEKPSPSNIRKNALMER